MRLKLHFHCFCFKSSRCNDDNGKFMEILIKLLKRFPFRQVQYLLKKTRSL